MNAQAAPAFVFLFMTSVYDLCLGMWRCTINVQCIFSNVWSKDAPWGASIYVSPIPTWTPAGTWCSWSLPTTPEQRWGSSLMLHRQYTFGLLERKFMFAEGEHANSTKKEPNKWKQRVALNETEMLHAPALSAHSLTIPALTAPTGHPFCAPSEEDATCCFFFVANIV